MVKTAEKPKSRTQAERSTASTEAMLVAAVELFEEFGSSVSLAKVGERAGFSHGLVMTRFQSKAGLVKAVTKRTQELFVEKIAKKSANKSGLDAILAMADNFSRPLDMRQSGGRAFYVLLGESLGPEKYLREEFVAIDEAFRSYIARELKQAISKGEIDPYLSVDCTAYLLVGMFRGSAIQTIVNPKAINSSKLGDQMRISVKRLLGVPEE